MQIDVHNKVKAIVITALVIGMAALLFSTSSASAQTYTLSRVIAGGLPANDPHAAMVRVQEQISVDVSLGTFIAQHTGSASYVASNFQGDGYADGAPDTSNSGTSLATGALDETGDTAECNVNSRVFRVQNMTTHEVIALCVACGNVRIPLVPLQPKPTPHTFVRTATVPVHVRESRSLKVCGKRVKFSVTVNVLIRAKTWGSFLGQLKVNISAAFTRKVKITEKATGKCTKVKVKVKPTPKPCQTGYQRDASGNCNQLVQTTTQNCPSGSTWDSNTQQCIAIQSNCSNINLSGNTFQGGNCNTVSICSGVNNCNTNTPPCTTCSTPPCTTCTIPPTPTMSVSNVTSPQEADNDGETYPNLYADVNSPNGGSITCTIGVVNPNDHTQSGFGSILGQRSFTFTSNGYDRVGPYTYQAPNDGTGSVDGQYDQLMVKCHDNSNVSVQDASAFSKPFEIMAVPTSP